MTRDLTYQRARRLERQIQALTERGDTPTAIARTMGLNRQMVTRVLQGKGVFCKLDLAYLEDAPTISDEAFKRMRTHSAPDDEERTTEEIYAAAEFIRERKPRDPVGGELSALMEIPVASISRMDGRSSRGVRSSE